MILQGKVRPEGAALPSRLWPLQALRRSCSDAHTRRAAGSLSATVHDRLRPDMRKWLGCGNSNAFYRWKVKSIFWWPQI